MNTSEELFGLLMEIQKLSRNFHCGDFTAPELKILSCIFEDPEGMTMGRIAELLKLGKSALSQAVSKLEGRGILTRSTASEDRRQVLVTFTEQGKALFEEKRQIILALLGRIVAEVGEERSRQLIESVRCGIDVSRKLVREDKNFYRLCENLSRTDRRSD